MDSPNPMRLPPEADADTDTKKTGRRRKVQPEPPRGTAGQPDDEQQTAIPGTEPRPEDDAGDADADDANTDALILHPTDRELRREIFETALNEGHATRLRHGMAPVGLEQIADQIAEFPKYLYAGVLHPHEASEQGHRWDAPWDQQDLGVMPVLQELRVCCSEDLGELREASLEVRWFSRLRKVRGKLLVGKAKPVPIQDRACYQGEAPVAPHFVVELSLVHWLVADDMQRRAMAHEALMYCGLRKGPSDQLVGFKRQPDVVAFGATLARFGLQDRETAQAMVAVKHHPTTAARLEQWEIPDGQLELFEPYRAPGRNL